MELVLRMVDCHVSLCSTFFRTQNYLRPEMGKVPIFKSQVKCKVIMFGASIHSQLFCLDASS